jgi:protein-tyrosine phosphatase
MVWQETESPAVVVMLTQLAEGYREKCYQYFPSEPDSGEMPLKFTDSEGDLYEGSLQVLETTNDELTKSTIRELALTYNGLTKTVYHLFFLAWPDFGVPQDTNRNALLSLIKLSRQKNGDSKTNPRIIHCSAGVGRSGTFIALEYLLDELESGAWDELEDNEDPIYETVNKLREQRMTMVQSDVQFAYLYDILANAYKQRMRERLASIANSIQKSAPTEKLNSNGEPSPKAIRISRGLRKILTDMRSRSASRRRSNEKDSRASSAHPDGEEHDIPSAISTPQSEAFNIPVQGKIP